MYINRYYLYIELRCLLPLINSLPLRSLPFYVSYESINIHSVGKYGDLLKPGVVAFAQDTWSRPEESLTSGLIPLLLELSK